MITLIVSLAVCRKVDGKMPMIIMSVINIRHSTLGANPILIGVVFSSSLQYAILTTDK